MPKFLFTKSRCGYTAGQVVDSRNIKPGLLKTLVRFGAVEQVKTPRKKADAVKVDSAKDDDSDDVSGDAE